MDWIRGLFTSAPGLDRLRPVGLILMVAGAAAAWFVAGALERRFGERSAPALLCRVGGLLLACAGALIAMA